MKGRSQASYTICQLAHPSQTYFQEPARHKRSRLRLPSILVQTMQQAYHQTGPSNGGHLQTKQLGRAKEHTCLSLSQTGQLWLTETLQQTLRVKLQLNKHVEFTPGSGVQVIENSPTTIRCDAYSKHVEFSVDAPPCKWSWFNRKHEVACLLPPPPLDPSRVSVGAANLWLRTTYHRPWDHHLRQERGPVYQDIVPRAESRQECISPQELARRK